MVIVFGLEELARGKVREPSKRIGEATMLIVSLIEERHTQPAHSKAVRQIIIQKICRG